MAALAVDVGTSMIKAVAYSDTGAELARTGHAVDVDRRRPGWAEQDMVAVWNTVVFTVRNVVAQVSEPIRFLAATAQGDGCWLVDAAGQPTGPAILWSDGRAAPIVEQWRADGVLREAFGVNGSLTFAGLPNAILTWLERHDADRLQRSTTALYCGGWLHLCLTGRRVVDESDASAPFLDLATRSYSEDALKLFGLDHLSDLLPEVAADSDRVSGLSAEAAVELGLPTGLPVVLAPYDVVATSIGAGAVRPGQACSILGTTLCTEVRQLAPELGGPAAGLTLAVDAHAVLRAFPTLAGTEVLSWASRLLGVPGPAQLGVLAEQADPGAGGVLLLPYLSPAGERAPFLDSDARGSFWGLSLEQGRPEIARAVFEGLTHVIADCLDATRAGVSELRCCGGGAVNDAWCQLIADVTGLPVVRTRDAEVGAKGAFLVGQVATGAMPDLAAAVSAGVREGTRWAPERRRADFYREHRARFAALRTLAQPGWRQPAARWQAS